LPALAVKAERARKKKTGPLLGKGKILLMDDNQPLLKSVGRLLKMVGYEVLTALDGAEAVEKYRAAFESDHPVDVVILDLIVPNGMGGIETATELLKMDANAKMIVSSGYTEDQAMSEFKKYGIKAVIPKPYSPEDLIREIKKII
jgi:CheY-like chemotaxis protein